MNEINKNIEAYKLQNESVLETLYMPKNLRKLLLKKLYKLILDNKHKIMDALFLDLNKSENEAYFTEIGTVLKSIKFTLKHINKWTKAKRVKTPITLFSGVSKIFHEPLGQVLIISPWNYPFYLSIAPLISAIAAGNRVIIKPSEYSFNTSQILQELMNNNFDPEYIFVSDSSLSTVQELLEHKFDLIFFTGSENVGTKICQEAAKFHTPVVLELGGKCPTIICDDFDLAKASEKIIYGKLLNAGQTCVAPDYVCVPKGKGTKFIEIAYEMVHKYLGRVPVSNQHFPKIITKNHFERLEEYLPKNEKIKSKNYKISPYIYLTNFNDEVMKSEIFGPILPVIEYDNYDEITNFIQSTGKPLATYLFTRNKKNINFFQYKISSGSLVIGVTINQLSSDYLPFGGVGSSGNGRYHGFTGFQTFSNIKSIYKKGIFNINLHHHPYTDKKLKWLEKILK
ncbi:aldehyde dehydrogenase family protein [Mycoplasmopsis felifaucium]|uniref:aldehyde dehydrogenase family protein n=1 Tax=Mycoplasmopsis felifaucium TaxID=35768 RepID=UPI0004829CE4|nr:aldehyde dehydrogenase family protein [Mycoplasmopsis felifaucium]